MSLTWQQAIGIETSHLVELNDSRHKNFYVHKDVIEPLKSLLAQAEKDGQAIQLVSGFRDFDRQLQIWNDKWQGFRPVYSRHGRPLNITSMSDIEKYKALSLWSAIPGLSRHHWGTDFDLFSAKSIDAGHKVELVPEEFGHGGPCAELEHWLQENLASFGFFRPYRDFRGGICEEPWHISHQSTSQAILDDFAYPEWQSYIKSSSIKSAGFIAEQLEHYKEKYFCNICEPINIESNS